LLEDNIEIKQKQKKRLAIGLFETLYIEIDYHYNNCATYITYYNYDVGSS